MALWHRRSPINWLHIFRTLFHKNTRSGLPLKWEDHSKWYFLKYRKYTTHLFYRNYWSFTEKQVAVTISELIFSSIEINTEIFWQLPADLCIMVLPETWTNQDNKHNFKTLPYLHSLFIWRQKISFLSESINKRQITLISFWNICVSFTGPWPEANTMSRQCDVHDLLWISCGSSCIHWHNQQITKNIREHAVL